MIRGLTVGELREAIALLDDSLPLIIDGELGFTLEVARFRGQALACLTPHSPRSVEEITNDLFNALTEDRD